MRQTVTITLEPETWERFKDECHKLRYTPSREIEQLMVQWLAERRPDTPHNT